MSNSIKFEIVPHPDSIPYRFSASSVDYVEPHFHHDFELLLPVYGKGQLIVSNGCLDLSVGDLCIVNPGEVHEIHTDSDSITFLCLQISPQYFKDQINRSGRLLFDENLLRATVPLEQVAYLSALLVEFGYQSLSQGRYSNILCISLLNLLIHSLLCSSPHQLLSEAEFLQIKTRNERILRAVNYVENNFQKRITLSDLAKAENLSVGYLSSFFRSAFNQTFQDYVNATRFSYARSLLYTNMRIIDISLESGFSDPRYLTKAFQKYEKCTPSEYRERLLNQQKRDLELGTGGALALGILGGERLLEILKRLRTPLGGGIEAQLNADAG